MISTAYLSLFLMLTGIFPLINLLDRSKDCDRETSIFFFTIVPNSDITLYAVWESPDSHSSGDVTAIIHLNAVVVGSYTAGWTNAQGFYFTWNISNPIIIDQGVKFTYYYIALSINVGTAGWKKLIKYESTGSWSSNGSEYAVLAIGYPPSAVMYYHGDSLLYRASTGKLVHRNGNLLYGPKYYTPLG